MTPRQLEPATIQAKLRLMRDLLDDLSAVDPASLERLAENRLLLRAVERILTQLVDLAVSINTHVGSALTGKAPSSYRSSFQQMASVQVLPERLVNELLPSVGMRNLLVHEYAAVDLARVAAAVPIARRQYAEYVRSMARWLLHPPGDHGFPPPAGGGNP